MNAIILEDEKVAMRRLRRMIQDIRPDIQVTHSFESITDTANHILEHGSPDLLFIDIQVADGNSLDLFDLVNIDSKVIFTTAYDQYAVDAFRKNAIDYLLKPVKLDELRQALQKTTEISPGPLRKISGTDSRWKSRFLIRIGSKFRVINRVDIAYIYSENKLSYFVLKDGTKVASDYKLHMLVDLLNPEEYFRANRQVIVHIDAISDILAYSKSRVKLKLSPPFKNEVVVSSETTPLFKKWLDR